VWGCVCVVIYKLVLSDKIKIQLLKLYINKYLHKRNWYKKKKKIGNF